MSLIVSDASAPILNCDWRDPENYRWMTELPRTAWAWEFLRRNPSYRGDYASHLAASGASNQPEHEGALAWSLLRFEDPAHDARKANVLWQMKACREVLPLAAAPMHERIIDGVPAAFCELCLPLSEDAIHVRTLLFASYPVTKK